MMELSNVRKKMVQPNMAKIQLYVMLILLNVTTKPSNVKKKIKELPNVTKVQSHVMLILLNVTMELSNVIKQKLKYHRM